MSRVESPTKRLGRRLPWLVACLGLLVLLPPAESPAADPPIKLGFFGPLTGPTSAAGQALLQGAQLRVKEINESGGVLGRQVELATCDDQSTAAVGVACVTRLIEQDRVFAIVGTLHSPIVLATAPITDRRAVPMVAAGVGDFCTKGFKYLWRDTADSKANARAIAVALDRLAVKSLAILAQNDDYGKSGITALRAIPGVNIVSTETYAPGDRDFSGQIIKMLAAKPDAIAVWALGDTVGFIANQLRQQGWKGRILGDNSFSFPEAVQVAGANLDGAVFAAVYYIPRAAADYPDPRVRDFLVRFQKQFGALPASDNAYRSYDGVTILTTGIKNAGALDADRVRDAINRVSALEGLAGTYNFVKGGGCEGLEAANLFEYKDRKVVPFTGK